jgi:peptide deformylase
MRPVSGLLPASRCTLAVGAIEDCEEYHEKLSPSQLSERQRQPVPFHVIVNPRIVSADNKGVEFFEGCLSVAGYSAIVPRTRAVTVEYLNEHWKPKGSKQRAGMLGSCKHEIHHLAGVLYVDRMRSCTLATLENLDRFWKDLPTSVVLAKLKSGFGNRTSPSRNS